MGEQAKATAEPWTAWCPQPRLVRRTMLLTPESTDWSTVLQRGFKVDVWARGKAADAPSVHVLTFLPNVFALRAFSGVVLAPRSDVLVVVDPDLSLSLLLLVGHVERELWCAMFMRITAL